MICIVLLWHFGWHQIIIISFKHFLTFATLLHHSTQLCDVLQLQSPFLLSIEFAKSVAQNPDKYVICSWIKKRKNKSEGCINISSYNNIHLLHRHLNHEEFYNVLGGISCLYDLWAQLRVDVGRHQQGGVGRR